MITVEEHDRVVAEVERDRAAMKELYEGLKKAREEEAAEAMAKETAKAAADFKALQEAYQKGAAEERSAFEYLLNKDAAKLARRIDRNRNLCLGTTATPTGGASCLVFGVAGTVLTPTTAQAGFYGETITQTEMRAVDSAANRTTITPHPGEVMDSHDARMRAIGLNPLTVPWGYRSSNDFAGIETVADMAAVVRCVEWLMSEAGRPISLVTETPLPGGPASTWEQRQEQSEQPYRREADAHDQQLRRWLAQPFWERGKTVKRPILGSTKPEPADKPAWLAAALKKLGA